MARGRGYSEATDEDSSSASGASGDGAPSRSWPVAGRHHLRRLVWQFLTVQRELGPVLQQCAIVYLFLTSAFVLLLFVVDNRTSRDETTMYFWEMQMSLFFIWTTEYLLRIWSCVEEIDDRMEERPIVRRCLQRMWLIVQPLMLLDLLAICSLAADLVIFENTFRGVSALRLLSLFRIERDFRVFAPVLLVVKRKQHLLGASLALSLLLVVVVSVCMFYLEAEMHSENFDSVTASMWWACVTMSTVGYGDVVPESTLGKVLAAATCFAGTAMFALPAGIIASGFQESLEKQEIEAQGNLEAIPEILAHMRAQRSWHQDTQRKLDAVQKEVVALRAEVRQLRGGA